MMGNRMRVSIPKKFRMDQTVLGPLVAHIESKIQSSNLLAIPIPKYSNPKMSIPKKF